jgi:integrase
VRKTLTDKGVQALKPRAERYAYPDPEMRSLYVRVTPAGVKTYVTVARNPYGKQVWHSIGGADLLKIEEAREQAREAIKRIKAGLPPLETPAVPPDSFKSVAENWIKRHVEKNELRTQPEIERCLKVYVYPHWEDRPFPAIKRSDFTELLDAIEDERGSRMADIVFGVVRSIGNWMAGRDDQYISPFNARGLRRSSGAKRSRILTDDELRTVWKQAEANGAFGAFIRISLLTGQRRAKIAQMKWDDLDNGEWVIPKEAREKDNTGALKLPMAARTIIEAQPKLGENPFVFAGRGDKAFNGFSKLKLRFDATLPHDDKGKPMVAPWTIHDLRRTFRSLLSRAGVRPDIAERLMGHAIPGIQGTYDRHTYRDEKAHGLKALAALIDAIVNPRDNVLRLSNRSKRRQHPGTQSRGKQEK